MVQMPATGASQVPLFLLHFWRLAIQLAVAAGQAEQLDDHALRGQCLAGAHAANRSDDLLNAHGLVQRAGRARLDRSRSLLNVAAGRQDESGGMRAATVQLSDQLDSIPVRQGKVEDRDVRPSPRVPRAAASDPTCPTTAMSGSRSCWSASASRKEAWSSTSTTRIMLSSSAAMAGLPRIGVQKSFRYRMARPLASACNDPPAPAGRAAAGDIIASCPSG
jgi:hypothetical protein